MNKQELDVLVAKMQQETAVAKAKMLLRADEIDTVIAKHGDPGGHLARMAKIYRDNGNDHARDVGFREAAR